MIHKTVDDIFAEGLSSPDFVVFLVNCIKNVGKQIDKIFSKTEETKNSQIKGKQHLMKLSRAVKLISKKFDEYEREKIMKEIKDMCATKTGRSNTPGEIAC